MNDYKCVTTIQGILDYLGDAKVVAFDYETSPDEPYRKQEKAALDPAKSHIVGCSFSVKERTGIYVPIKHLIGTNINSKEFFMFLQQFLADRSLTKVAHNISFESMFSYHLGSVILLPVYDTIAAAQMTLKNRYEFRKLFECGLKKLVADLCKEPLPSFSDVTDGKHFDELDAQDEETVRYGAADSDFSLRLYNLFNGWFDKYLPKHRWIVENIESPTAVYLGIMKHNGAPVDLEKMELRKKEAEEAQTKLREEIAFMIGDVNIGANCSTKAFKEDRKSVV